MKIYRFLAMCGFIGFVGTGAIYISNPKHFDHQSEHSGLNRNLSNHHAITGGEAAFSEISRVVDLLSNDPNNNWSNVNISALRKHLIDMSNVTLHAEVTPVRINNGMEYLVTGDNPKFVESIQTMVQAHSAMMDSESDFDWKYTIEEQGARIAVTGRNETGYLKIKALGFHGLLALGHHHSQHHEMLASGRNPH